MAPSTSSAGRNHLQYRKELEVGDKFSFVLSSKEIRSILGVKGTNIEAIRDAANAIIHCKKYNGEEKLILEGSEDAKNKAKTLINFRGVPSKNYRNLRQGRV